MGSNKKWWETKTSTGDKVLMYSIYVVVAVLSIVFCGGCVALAIYASVFVDWSNLY